MRSSAGSIHCVSASRIEQPEPPPGATAGGNSLPLPPTDNQDHRASRMRTAIETFDALRPFAAYEAQLAVQIVLCGAHASDCLREGGVHRDDFAKMIRCRAQAASLMREARAARRTLAQEQKARAMMEPAIDAQPGKATAPVPAQQAAAPSVQAAAAAPASAPAQQPRQTEAAPPASPEATARAEALTVTTLLAIGQARGERGITPEDRAAHTPLPNGPAAVDALLRARGDSFAELDGLDEAPEDAA